MIYTVKRIEEDLDFGCEEPTERHASHGNSDDYGFFRRRNKDKSRGCHAL